MVRSLAETRPLPWEGVGEARELAFAVGGGERPWRALEVSGDAHAAREGATAAELLVFQAGRSVIVPDREARERLLATGPNALAGPARVVTLADLAALLFPGRPPVAPRAESPAALFAATSELVERFLARAPEALALFAHAIESLHGGLAREAPPAAAELAFAAALCEHPSAWGARAPLLDGGLSRAHAAHASLEDALEAAQPAWTRAAHARGPELLVRADDPVTLDAADRAAVDRALSELLPALLARDGRPSYRPGQHAVAARIAQSFGERELLLVHAPTGTGKTLAYLVPTMLWAYRQGVRVGVATFTRALQSQAMERDVPLARDVLAELGVPREEGRGVRVSVLKGRSNYVCWRALVQSLPPPESPVVELLAWLGLVLFALEDGEGDLDRFASSAPLAGLERATWRTASQRALRLARAEPGCCTREAERRTCGAEAARERAERSHVVLTNHAFALSRPEFLRHLVFDECEHLHSVAHDAFSHAISLSALRELLGRFHRRGGSGGERPLGRIAALATAGSALWNEASAAIGALDEASRALTRLTDQIEAFEAWRATRLSRVPTAPEAADAVADEPAERAQEPHALFRAYVESEEGAELDRAHAELVAGLDGLALGAQRVVEELDLSPARGAPRLRRSFDVLRRELSEALDAVRAWIPRAEDGGARFGPAVFHDLERTSGGEPLLVARVLLPHEFLGRRTYPDLAGAVFLSATTWLRGGFETAALYLGLARAAAPGEDEQREPARLATFRAEDPFDYSRVLVLVPKDAPSVKDKGAFLDYTARFVGDAAARTRGRMLVLFTNAEDLAAVARRSAPALAEHGLSFFWQGMEESTKEELAELFRAHREAVLFGLDTFWFGTDFPGRTLEVLVLVRLPYGVPDRYHEAQCAAIGAAEQRRAIYLPRALAKFRQGFGRLMRRENDHGCVFVLDRRILDPRHRAFLRELPLRGMSPLLPARTPDAGSHGDSLQVGERLASLISHGTDSCLAAATGHLARMERTPHDSLPRPRSPPVPPDASMS